LFDGRDSFDEKLGKFGFRFRRRAKARSPSESLLDRLDDGRMPVTENVRSPGADVIDQPIPVDVVQILSVTAGDEQRLSPDGSKRAGGAVDASGDHARCAGERGTA